MFHRSCLISLTNHGASLRNSTMSSGMEHFNKQFYKPLPEDIKERINREMKKLTQLEAKDKWMLLIDLKNCINKEMEMLEPRSIRPHSGYPEYKKGDAFDFLKENWGKYLRYFNKALDQDYLYQDWLRRLDENLMIALDVQVRRHRNMRLAEIVPPKKVRLNFLERQIAMQKKIAMEVN